MRPPSTAYTRTFKVGENVGMVLQVARGHTSQQMQNNFCHRPDNWNFLEVMTGYSTVESAIPRILLRRDTMAATDKPK